jgi:hypothetical protein
MTVKQFFKERTTSHLLPELNEELLQDRIIRFWQRVGSHLTLSQLVEKYWGETKSEFCVDLGVTFGKITELYLPFAMMQAGLDTTPSFSSSGDVLVDDIHWEIKTGRGGFIQGATHSPKEKSEMNLIQILWDCHWDKTLDEILEDRQFIKELNICVFEGVVVNSVGQHSDNNSRTTLQFKRHMIDECIDACVYGAIKQNRINIKFVKEPVGVQ